MENKYSNRLYLNTGWKFSLYKSKVNLKDNPNLKIKTNKLYDAVVPGTIHTDLLNNNIIDDPFYSDNEKKLKWIEQCDWIYKTEFNLDKNTANKYDLVFEGLDTIAEVFLNDKMILSAENMFLNYTVEVSKHLRNGKNFLNIIFNSPVNFANRQEEKYGKLDVALNSSRVYIRKAQYSFGWDWGPIFPSSGIWKSIYIEEKQKIKIINTTFQTIENENNVASVRIGFDLDKIPLIKYSVIVELSDCKQIVRKTISKLKQKNNSVDLEIPNPELWWPNGEGSQNLYLLKIKIINKSNQILNEFNRKVGIRTVELVLNENGTNVFKFKINNKVIFAKGVNWIPADSFLPRIAESKYKNLLSSAKDANMNIIRVWGGGIYESDKFYEICDELGLMVWQDFMFACAAYPEHKDFIKNIKTEIKQNVLRLQHHPSIIIWCGNNENEWIWYQEKNISYKNMPGFRIFNDIIPDIINQIDNRPYWQSSPFSFEKDPNSPLSGNRHQWELWSKWIDYNEVVNDKSLFVTEFGFQAPANITTMEKCLPPQNRNIQDSVFEFHNKQIEGNERIIRFLAKHFPISIKFDEFIYLAQLNQAHALYECLKHWRTNNKTFGSIIWQLNDCWPVASWSLIDSEQSPKISYHFVKNIFAQQIIYFDKKDENIIIKIQNQADENKIVKCEVKLIETITGKVTEEFSKSISLKNKSEIEVLKYSDNKILDKFILYANLKNDKGEQLSFSFHNKLPWKYYKVAQPKIKINIVSNNPNQIEILSDKPAYFVDLFAEGITFSKRGFSIMPNEKVIVNIYADLNKMNISKIKIYSLNTFLI
ncbi:MAG: hypothetical protein IPK06_16555 [Ignavibacteriae bacterium]|nr:hypothetical protein [Ignavibacteriota bacterium]